MRGRMSASPPPDDAHLALAMAAGDEFALARAYDAHAPRVYGLALRIVRRPHDAEEILQDVFMTLWRTAARFDPARGSLVAWLTTLTRHRAIDRLRARRARPDAALGVADDPPTPVDDGAGPLERASALEDAGLAVSALTGLPAEERRVLELAYFDGLTQTEIAQRTGDPLGTVKGRTRNALRRLRDAMPPLFGGVR